MQHIKILKLFIILSMATLAIGMSSLTTQALTGARDDNLRRGGNGKPLFDHETFGGNGRTCLTCHGRDTGTISPEEVQARFADDPNDPLFVHDGSDDAP